MKLMERMKQKRMGNKGFSLVELIIVIAIMAILVGIVGTQVVPYLNRARQSADRELLSAYATAAMSAYTFNPEEDYSNPINVFDGSGNADTSTPFLQSLNELTSYNTLDEVNDILRSGDATNITITFNFTTHTLEVSAPGSGVEAVESTL